MSKPPAFVIELDQMELVILILEAAWNITRPQDLTTKEAFDSLSPQVKENLLRIAEAVSTYLVNQLMISVSSAVH